MKLTCLYAGRSRVVRAELGCHVSALTIATKLTSFAKSHSSPGRERALTHLFPASALTLPPRFFTIGRGLSMSQFRTILLSTVPFALLMATANPAVAEEEMLSAKAIQLSDNYAARIDGGNPNDAPISFSADSMTRDETAGTITAHGHVEMEQAGRILKADQVVYSVTTGKLNAIGHVVLLDANGDVHLADSIDLSDQMKVANATNMRSTMKDGSRMWA
jgi:lipopolysaccharide export system protein LptA